MSASVAASIGVGDHAWFRKGPRGKLRLGRVTDRVVFRKGNFVRSRFLVDTGSAGTFDLWSDQLIRKATPAEIASGRFIQT